VSDYCLGCGASVRTEAGMLCRACQESAEASTRCRVCHSGEPVFRDGLCRPCWTEFPHAHTDYVEEGPYAGMSHDDFVELILREMSEHSLVDLLKVPGAWEVYSEHFNNEAFDRWTKARPLAGPSR
jgi:hypothetical protein